MYQARDLGQEERTGVTHRACTKPTTSGVGMYRRIGVVPGRRPSVCAEVAVLVSTPQEL